MADDLVERVRDFARGHDAEVVSSAFLSRQLQVDVRTIAAALRRHDVRPQDVDSVRGYVVAELVNVGESTCAAGLPDDWAEMLDVSGSTSGKPCRPIPYDDVEPLDAVAALSAGAGHDMTPALKAAGLM